MDKSVKLLSDVFKKVGFALCKMQMNLLIKLFFYLSKSEISLKFKTRTIKI